MERIGRIGNKSKKALANINKIFNERSNAIKFVDDYGSMRFEAKRKKTEEEPKTEPIKAKTKRKKFQFQLHKKFINEIKNDEKNKNEHLFKEDFFYHTPLFS